MVKVTNFIKIALFYINLISLLVCVCMLDSISSIPYIVSVINLAYIGVFLWANDLFE